MFPAKQLSSTGKPQLPSARKARKWNATQQGNCSSPETQILRPFRCEHFGHFCWRLDHAGYSCVATHKKIQKDCCTSEKKPNHPHLQFVLGWYWACYCATLLRSWPRCTSSSTFSSKPIMKSKKMRPSSLLRCKRIPTAQPYCFLKVKWLACWGEETEPIFASQRLTVIDFNCTLLYIP